MNSPTLSLVTGARNRPESFMRLLESITTHTSVDWELVVSDASDTPMTFNGPQVRILPEVPRLGCTKGFNRAFKEALGEWIIWLNDDAEVVAGYDVTAIRFMELHPTTGLGALHYSESGGPFRVNSAWGAIYANFGIVRRDLGESVGFFDEHLEMYGCDPSFAFRILLAGYGVSDIPAARIIHHADQDRERIENQKHKHRDNEILKKKYYPLRNKWLPTYQKLRVQTGTTPWTHGVEPRAAAVR